MTKKIEVFAPAKINLYLHITGKRPDGFHELETLMVPISLGDILHLELTDSPGIALTCSRSDLPVGTSNLAYRAASLFFDTYRLSVGVRIHLDKKSPVGAGLGGGSSDAAHVLLALRDLTRELLEGMDASDAALANLAASMGSDIPFFIYRRPALCKGRGEIIEPCADWNQTYHGVLIHPGFGVSTPWAYQTYARDPQRGEEGARFAFGVLRNDLEPPVFGKYVWLPTAKQWLLAQSEVRGALMSGSGSSVFALVDQSADAEAVAARFKAEFGASILAVPFRTLRE